MTLKKILVSALAISIVFSNAVFPNALSPKDIVNTDIKASALLEDEYDDDDYEVETLKFGDFEYYLDDENTAWISSYTGAAAQVEVPAEINGSKVETIDNYSFESCRSIKKLVLPEGLKNIRVGAFSGCTSLTTINMPSSLEYVDSSAFEDTPIIRNQATDIKYVDNWAVTCNSEVETLSVKEGTVAIADMAFANCYYLTSVDIPASVQKIGTSFVDESESLTTINVDPANNYFTSENGILYSKDKAELLVYPRGIKASSVIIPDGVKTIGEYAFYDCYLLENITLPNSLTEIKDGAFSSCEKLLSIDIPDSVTKIGENAFDSSAITTLKLPAQLTEISSFAFQRCENLKSLNIPQGVEKIGELAFSCSGLTAVTIPSSVKTIGEAAFTMCSDLKSVSMAEGVETIGEAAFFMCEKLQAITIPNSVKTIGSTAFSVDQMLKTVKLGNGITKIDEMTFALCEKLSSVTIPDSVTTIGAGAFTGCISLKSISIPSKVKMIDVAAFADCPLIKSVKIPKSVTKIGEYALGYVSDEANEDVLRVPGFKIYCYVNSAAEKYAKSNKFSYDFVDVAKPAAVTGFKAAATSTSAVKLTWKKVSGANGYIIYKYDTAKKNWVRIAKTKNNTNSYRVSKLPASTTLKFAVKAYKTVNGKEISSVKYPQITTATKPKTVTLKVSSSNKKAVLKWNKLAGVSGYEVYYKTSAKDKWTKLKTTAETSYTKSGLTKGKTYYFTVRAYKKVGKAVYKGAFAKVRSVKIK